MGSAAAKMLPAAAPPLDDDDLLSEILLRLPPLPSSIPRVSTVCKRWHTLVTDRGFIRRFRLRHRRNPPLLGYFHQDPGSINPRAGSLRFEPTMEPPNHVPSCRFSSPIDNGDDFRLLGCRHGLVLILQIFREQVLVWDPVTGDQHRVATPPGFGMYTIGDGTVLRADHHFQAVLVGYDDFTEEQGTRAIVFIYSSETRLWSTLISPLLPDDVVDYEGLPAVFVGNSLYWLILEVDLCRQSISAKPVPVEDMYAIVILAESGGVGLLSMSDYTVQLWEMNTNCDGAASWLMGRTFELDKLLSLKSQEDLDFLGYAEGKNVVHLRTFDGNYMVHLESLEVSKLVEDDIFICYPFESVYAAGIGDGQDGSDQDVLV